MRHADLAVAASVAELPSQRNGAVLAMAFHPSHQRLFVLIGQRGEAAGEARSPALLVMLSPGLEVLDVVRSIPHNTLGRWSLNDA